MSGVPGAKAFGHQDLHLLPHHLVPLVAEHLLGLAVHQDDGAVPVHDHQGVGRRLQQAPESQLRCAFVAQALDQGDVLLVRDNEAHLSARLSDGAHGHVDMDEGPGLGPPDGLERRQVAFDHLGQRATSLNGVLLGDDQLFQQPPHRFFRAEPEDRSGSEVPEQDPAIGRQGDEGVGRLVDQGPGQLGGVGRVLVAHARFEGAATDNPESRP
jgi:hypothetical protein